MCCPVQVVVNPNKGLVGGFEKIVIDGGKLIIDGREIPGLYSHRDVRILAGKLVSQHPFTVTP